MLVCSLLCTLSSLFSMTLICFWTAMCCCWLMWTLQGEERCPCRVGLSSNSWILSWILIHWLSCRNTTTLGLHKYSSNARLCTLSTDHHVPSHVFALSADLPLHLPDLPVQLLNGTLLLRYTLLIVSWGGRKGAMVFANSSLSVYPCMYVTCTLMTYDGNV